MPNDWSWITNPQNWYWFVGSDQTQVYSSMKGIFVVVADSDYVEWLSAGNVTTPVQDILSLATALADTGAPLPVDADVLLAYKNYKIERINVVGWRILFNHENHIRSLNNETALSEIEFLDAIREYI